MTEVQVPPGMVVITTWGLVTAESAQCLADTRSFCDDQGLKNIQWRMIHGALVDKARNDAFRAMLNSQAQWILMIDADMIWEPDAIVRLLSTAFGTHPQYDVLGAYCNLRGNLALPTIDTGTGTWESHYPGQGVMSVMRTGGAFLLVKRHVAERVPGPWFALRVPMRPLDAVAEVDTFCRTVFDGRNPFRGDSWERLEKAAATHPSAQGPWLGEEVGEDSSFCDRVTSAGLSIGVQSDIVVKHLDREVKDWTFHRKAMDERVKQERLLSGFTE